AEVSGRAGPRAGELELADAVDAGRAATTDGGTERDPSPSSSSARRARTGTLVVRVEDATSRAPLERIALRVVRERGGDQLLAIGTTDAHGEARFEQVEANTVIVEAQRTATHARAFGAAWLEKGESETVVV